MIARHMPGIGDPMSLTVPELDEWCEALGHMLRKETSTDDVSDHRARVEAEMRRLAQ